MVAPSKIAFFILDLVLNEILKVTFLKTEFLKDVPAKLDLSKIVLFNIKFSKHVLDKSEV